MSNDTPLEPTWANSEVRCAKRKSGVPSSELDPMVAPSLDCCNLGQEWLRLLCKFMVQSAKTTFSPLHSGNTVIFCTVICNIAMWYFCKKTNQSHNLRVLEHSLPTDSFWIKFTDCCRTPGYAVQPADIFSCGLLLISLVPAVVFGILWESWLACWGGLWFWGVCFFCMSLDPSCKEVFSTQFCF